MITTAARLLALSLSACLAAGCAAHRLAQQNLLVFNPEKKLVHPLRSLGFEGHTASIVGKSSDGGKIVVRDLRDRYYLLESGRPPRALDWPAESRVWLDGDCERLAWTDRARPGIHFRGGAVFPTTAWETIEFSQDGAYFCLWDEREHTTRLYSSDAPLVPLTELEDGPGGCRPSDIFTRGGRLYVMTYVDAEDNCWVFSCDDGRCVRERTIRVPGQFVDIDPPTGTLLLVEPHDMPFPDRYFLYDLETGRTSHVGYSINRIAIFVRRDLLDPAAPP